MLQGYVDKEQILVSNQILVELANWSNWKTQQLIDGIKMISSLNEVLKEFEAIEANLNKLERLWREISALFPSSQGVFAGVEDQPNYRGFCRSFNHIATRMPAIDGFKLENAIPDADDVTSYYIAANEVGDIEAHISYLNLLYKQEEILEEYRFRFDVKRRQMARKAIPKISQEIEVQLGELRTKAEELADENEKMPDVEWADLCERIKAIDALLGSSVERPEDWSNLSRHLHFGLKCDFLDIVKRDWLAVKGDLDKSLCTENEPLPVHVKDLEELVTTDLTGPITTQLHWSRLEDEDFERLIFNLISESDGYENPEWLTRTNAPDKGRDLSVYRIHKDPLSGNRRFRVFIACKHWLKKSVGIPELTTLEKQMSLWELPRIDILVISTTGRFTSDAVSWIEKHNESDKALRIEMWPENHLERLLAKRPALIAEFGLR